MGLGELRLEPEAQETGPGANIERARPKTAVPHACPTLALWRFGG